MICRSTILLLLPVVTSIFFYLILAISNNLWAITQEASIQSSYAIIYADQELKIPIGKISQGKQIIVGNSILKKNNTIYPLIIHGKIYFTAAENLKIQTENKIKKISKRNQDISLINTASRSSKKQSSINNSNNSDNNDMEKILETYDEDNLTISFKKKSLYTHYQSFSIKNQNAHMLSAGIELWPQFTYAIITGADYIFSPSGNNSISSLGLKLAGITRIYRFKYLNTFASLEGHYFPFFNYSDYKGTATAFNLGLRAIYPVNKTFDFKLGLDYSIFKTITNNKSFSLLLGIAYYYQTAY
ncbi:MAG: hypothetical protein HQK51_03665 [Oligoflexia bacterium]|nr:hypothetical protein [Oligoflexia bacterium]